MPSHPINDEELLAYLAGELTGEDHARVAAHVLACDACTATTQHFDAIRAILRADDSSEPPAPLIAKVNQLFTTEPHDELTMKRFYCPPETTKPKRPTPSRFAPAIPPSVRPSGRTDLRDPEER